MQAITSKNLYKPTFSLLKMSVAAYAAYKAVKSIIDMGKAKEELSFRKRQLAKDVYELKGDELVNPPWNKDNINQWIYRRVKVTGRPLHYKTCFIPREVYGRPGFEYVVPLVTLEDPATGEYSGLVLSKGFIQFEWKDPSYRWRIENVDAQTFEGFVSDLRELKRTSIFQGNNPDTAHLNFTHSDTKDFAEATGFANKKQASVAMIERLEPGGPFDERDGAHYAHGASYQNQYPFAKTLAGALQLRKMPWDCANQAKAWGALSALAVFTLAL